MDIGHTQLNMGASFKLSIRVHFPRCLPVAAHFSPLSPTKLLMAVFLHIFNNNAILRSSVRPRAMPRPLGLLGVQWYADWWRDQRATLIPDTQTAYNTSGVTVRKCESISTMSLKGWVWRALLRSMKMRLAQPLGHGYLSQILGWRSDGDLEEEGGVWVIVIFLSSITIQISIRFFITAHPVTQYVARE